VVVPKVRVSLWTFPNNQQAGHHGGLMHIESTTAFHQSLHDASLAEAIAAPQGLFEMLCVLPVFPGATKRGTFTGAGQTP